jgi:colanic acid/amylovoran biosynthesis glycosyltransferase
VRIKVAHIWDEYLFSSFVEVHPLFARHAPLIDSITIARTLWDNGNTPDGTVFAQRKLPLQALMNPSLARRILAFFERRFFTASYLKFLKALQIEHSIEITHFHFGFTAAQYPEASFQRPFIVTFYGSDVSSALRSPFWVSRYRSVLPKASALLVLCEEARERLQALGCSRDKIHVWNLPAGVEKYPYQEGTSSSIPRLIMTARFVEKKGHGLLLDALESLKNENIQFQATFLGYGPGKAAIEESLHRRNLSAWVKVVDTACQGDFATLHYRLLKEHDLFVLPSIQAKNGDDEGGPALTMVCAQSAGLPVVCTSFPGSEITMQNGKTGFIAEEASGSCLAATLKEAFLRKASWKNMGIEGSRLAHENFGEEQQVRKLAALYETIVRAQS